jgi:hypothetical protein
MFGAVIPLAISLATQSHQPTHFTVTAVQTTQVFAGRLGSRILTDLVLTSGQRTLNVRIQDMRHSRFQSTRPRWNEGDEVVVVVGEECTRVALAPSQIKNSR